MSVGRSRREVDEDSERRLASNNSPGERPKLSELSDTVVYDEEVSSRFEIKHRQSSREESPLSVRPDVGYASARVYGRWSHANKK